MPDVLDDFGSLVKPAPAVHDDFASLVASSPQGRTDIPTMRAATAAEATYKRPPSRIMSYDPEDPLGYAQAKAAQEGGVKGFVRGNVAGVLDPRMLALGAVLSPMQEAIQLGILAKGGMAARDAARAVPRVAKGIGGVVGAGVMAPQVLNAMQAGDWPRAGAATATGIASLVLGGIGAKGRAANAKTNIEPVMPPEPRFNAPNVSRESIAPAVESSPQIGAELTQPDLATIHAETKSATKTDYGRDVLIADAYKVAKKNGRIPNNLTIDQFKAQVAKVGDYDAYDFAAAATGGRENARARAGYLRGPKEIPNAVQEQGAGGVLQRQSQETGVGGGERGGVEQSQQGQAPPGQGPEAPTQEEIAPPPSPLDLPVRGTGRFAPAYKHGSKATGHAVDALGAVPETINFEKTMAERNVLSGLTDAQKQDLGDLVVSENLKVVNPSHPQVLSDPETNRIISDPAIAAAVNAHATMVDPIARDYAVRAGVKPNEGRSGIYIPLQIEDTPPGAGLGTSSSVAARLRATKSRYANPARGSAELYDTSMENAYDRMFRENVSKAAHRDVYAALKSAGKLSDTPQPGYKAVELRKYPIVDANGKTHLVPETKYIPEKVARTIEDARNIGAQDLDPAESSILASQRLATGLQLTGNPTELASHMHRQTTVLSKMPDVNGSVLERVAAPLINTVSGGANLGTKGEVAARLISDDMSSPENQQIMRDLYRSGGASSRAFRQYTVSKVPGVSAVQSAAHDLLFAVPEGKGVKGYDIRVRVAMEKIRRQVEGNTDPQRIRDFANQLGQYTDKPLHIIERLRFLNPYLASQLPMRITEMRQLFGGTGLKPKSFGRAAGIRTEALLRGAGSTAVGFITANRVLSGKWPWQNAPGHEFDLNTGKRDKKGQTIYVRGNRALSPNDMRAMNTLGIPELIAEKRGTNKPDYLSAAERGGVNAALSTVAGSPLANAVGAGVGLASYLTKPPGKKMGVLDVSNKPPKGRPQGVQNLIDAVRSLHPAGALIPTGAKENLKGQADLGNSVLQRILGQYTAGARR